MEIKYKKRINDYDYIVMFDLASKITGICVWDILNKVPFSTQVIKVDDAEELPFADLKKKISDFFGELGEKVNLKKCLISKEMMPVQIHGGSSTVQTFVALAKSHVILDVFCYENKIDCYDYKGIAPATTHAYYKHLAGLGLKDKVTKEMVRDYLYSVYPDHMEVTTLDETDAIFLAKTLYDIKWNKDIDEKIREEKRHKKKLKAFHAISMVDEEIDRLKSLKIE